MSRMMRVRSWGMPGKERAARPTLSTSRTGGTNSGSNHSSNHNRSTGTSIPVHGRLCLALASVLAEMCAPKRPEMGVCDG